MSELDRYIIGQADAKRAVAIALRNRWRRHQLPADIKDDIMPKNILMIGPTGSGKTEIARRLAMLTDSPFIKVEATKFTEIGFHGKDVDSIIVDLVRAAIQQQKTKHKQRMRVQIQYAVEARILDALIGSGGSREDFVHLLRNGQLDNQEIDIEVPVKLEQDSAQQGPAMAGASSSSSERAIDFALRGLSGNLGMVGRKEMRRLKVSEAIPLLEESEYDALMSAEEVVKQAITAVQQDGIVFLDEIDKICTPSHSSRHADASDEGVQRDLLPLIEGTTVTTKHGDVQTDHILFIASGAFHAVKPSDLLAELQGRLPIRVELKALTEADLYAVLTKTEHNLIKQQIALLEVLELQPKSADFTNVVTDILVTCL